MKREDAIVGMLVVLGKPDQEQTLGKIVKINPARAKVETLEEREGREVGTIWNVPYHLMKPAEDEAPAS